MARMGQEKLRGCCCHQQSRSRVFRELATFGLLRGAFDSPGKPRHTFSHLFLFAGVEGDGREGGRVQREGAGGRGEGAQGFSLVSGRSEWWSSSAACTETV